MTLKRLDTLEVATSELDDAVATYQRNFGFKLMRRGAESAVLAIGDAQIELKSGSAAEPVLKSTGEGMAALWLEAGDIDSVAAALRKAGFKFEPPRIDAGRRILAVAPASASQVRLFIFDRKT